MIENKCRLFADGYIGCTIANNRNNRGPIEYDTSIPEELRLAFSEVGLRIRLDTELKSEIMQHMNQHFTEIALSIMYTTFKQLIYKPNLKQEIFEHYLFEYCLYGFSLLAEIRTYVQTNHGVHICSSWKESWTYNGTEYKLLIAEKDRSYVLTELCASRLVLMYLYQTLDPEEDLELSCDYEAKKMLESWFAKY